MTNHKLDTDNAVFFYEQEFYALSNFSSFRLSWSGIDFDTVEHAYHWSKFTNNVNVQATILRARSAHEAFRLAQKYKDYVRSDWIEVRRSIMKSLLASKINQHPYVKQKLLETGSRLLVEDSWRDAYWGIGPDGDGENVLGKLWMELRDELLSK